MKLNVLKCNFSKFMILVIGLSIFLFAQVNIQAAQLPADQVQAIAKEAYVYGFPMIDNYRVMSRLRGRQ